MIRIAVAASLLAIVLGGCAEATGVIASRASAELNEPSESASVEAAPVPIAESSPSPVEVRAAFLELMGDPDVAFHADTKLDAVFTSHGEKTAVTYLMSADVVGGDYAVSTSITKTDPSGASERYALEAIAIGDSILVRSGTEPWAEIDRPENEEPMNLYLGLRDDEVTFIGMTADDLYEFNIRTWIGRTPASFDDTLSEVAALEAFYLGDHTTTVTVDAAGVPQTLSSSYAMRTVIDAIPGTAHIVQEYSRVGDPIRINIPSDALTAASSVAGG